MPKMTMKRVVLTAIVAMPAFALLGMTAEAQTKSKAKVSRETAIQQCIAKAYAAEPTAGATEGGQTRRVAVYKDCMTQAGFRP